MSRPEASNITQSNDFTLRSAGRATIPSTSGLRLLVFFELQHTLSVVKIHCFEKKQLLYLCNVHFFFFSLKNAVSRRVERRFLTSLGTTTSPSLARKEGGGGRRVRRVVRLLVWTIGDCRCTTAGTSTTLSTTLSMK